MRTQQEILDQINSPKVAARDFFGFERGDYVSYLTWPHVKPFLNDDVTEEQWKPLSAHPDDIKKQMHNYMDFAWGKANNKRGLSAARSLQHYTAWLWMMGDEVVAALGDFDDYEYYGKPQLIRICEYFGWDHTQWDDGIRENE